jgi:hypothetical protein
VKNATEALLGTDAGGNKIGNGKRMLTAAAAVGEVGAAAGGPEVFFKSAHGARHLVGTGLSAAEVEGAIGRQVASEVEGASATGSFGGRVSVGGKIIEYRGFTLPSGDINIGTYYPK